MYLIIQVLCEKNHYIDDDEELQITSTNEKSLKQKQTSTEIPTNNNGTSTLTIVGIVFLSIAGILYLLYQLGKHGLRKQNEEILNINIGVCENTIKQLKEKNIDTLKDPIEKDKLNKYKEEIGKILKAFNELKNTINKQNIFLLSGQTLVETMKKNNNIVNEKLNPLLTEIHKSNII
jgi:hypothetical protein